MSPRVTLASDLGFLCIPLQREQGHSANGSAAAAAFLLPRASLTRVRRFFLKMTVTRFTRERPSLAYLWNTPLAAFKGIPALAVLGSLVRCTMTFFFFFGVGGFAFRELAVKQLMCTSPITPGQYFSLEGEICPARIKSLLSSGRLSQ